MGHNDSTSLRIQYEIREQTTKQQRDERLAEFQAIASEWDGDCLSDGYINQHTPLEFQCAVGPRWSAQPSNVYHNKSWCPHSCQTPGTVLRMRRQLLRLSEIGYNSVHKPLRWQCAAGHQFISSLTSVKVMGCFCKECQKLTLGEFQRLFGSIHYTLLSDSYVNNYTHIHVLCGKGHPWRVQPKHLKEGHRCPDCRCGDA